MRKLRIVLTVLLLFAVVTTGIASAEETKSISIDVPSSATTNEVTTVPVTIHGGEDILSFLVKVPNSVSGTTITIRAPEATTSGTYTLASEEENTEQKVLWFTPSEGITGTETLFLIDVLPTDASPETIPLTIEVLNQMYNADYVEIHAEYPVVSAELPVVPSPQTPDVDDPTDPMPPGFDTPSDYITCYPYVSTDIPEGSVLVDIDDPTSTIAVEANGVIRCDDVMKLYHYYKVQGETDGEIYYVTLPSSSLKFTDSNGKSQTFSFTTTRDLGLTLEAIPKIAGYEPKELVFTLKKDWIDDGKTQVILPLTDDGILSIPNLEETDLVGGYWEISAIHDEADFPGLDEMYLMQFVGCLDIVPSVVSGSPERTDAWVNTLNTNVPALVAVELKPEDLDTLTAPVITRNGLSVTLTEAVNVQFYEGFETETGMSYSRDYVDDTTLNDDKTLNLNGEDISNAYTVSVYFEGRVLGDATGDGRVDEADYTRIANSLVGVETLTDTELFYSDVSGDGIVDALDAIMISQMLEGSLDINYA